MEQNSALELGVYVEFNKLFWRKLLKLKLKEKKQVYYAFTNIKFMEICTAVNKLGKCR